MLKELQYNCIDSSGQEIKGIISASDRMDALSKLRERGLTVIELVEKKKKRGISIPWRKGFGDSELYNISKELSILLRAGLRIDKAFDLLINPSMKEEHKEILIQILREVKAGKELSRAFEETGHFPPLFITMIRVGETVGSLESAFENISLYYRFQIQYKGELRNALTYPAFLIFASIITLVFIFTFIIPRFFSIFGTDLATLPLPAKILFYLSEWLTPTNLIILGSVVLILFLLRKYLPLKSGFSNLYSYFLELPLIGRLILNLELSRFSYSMYSMLQSGIEFIKALKLSSALIQNRRLRIPIESLLEQIKEGKKISDVFSQVHFLPEIVSNMLRVGEGSGNLKEVFFELYQIFDERFKNSTKRVLALIEPAIIVLMGFIVGSIVISLILTVMSVGRIKL